MMSRKIIGVDEVGRGCLAGPVVCAAVILPDKHPSWVDDLRDSKKISPKKRQKFAELITETCVYAIREGPPHQIDDINILQATLWTMNKCVGSLLSRGVNADLVLVDGNHKIPGISLPQEAIKGGDDLHKAISAASIIAKVYRDNFMIGMDHIYPEYGFAKHKGYGTEEHREAIMIHGPCKMHRLTFKGVWEYVKSPNTLRDFAQES
jgi:ribonuclease HII